MATLIGRLASVWLLFWFLSSMTPRIHFDFAYGLYAVVFMLASLGCVYGPQRALRAFADPLQLAKLDVRRCEENLGVVNAGKRYALVAALFAVVVGGWNSATTNAGTPWLTVSWWLIGAFQGWLIAFLLVDALGTTYRSKRTACLEGRDTEEQSAAVANSLNKFVSGFGRWFGQLSPRGKVAFVATVIVIYLIWSPFADDEEKHALAVDLPAAKSELAGTTLLDVGSVRIWDGESGSIPKQYRAEIRVATLYSSDDEETSEMFAERLRSYVRDWMIGASGTHLEQLSTQARMGELMLEHIENRAPSLRGRVRQVLVSDFEVTPWPSARAAANSSPVAVGAVEFETTSETPARITRNGSKLHTTPRDEDTSNIQSWLESALEEQQPDSAPKKTPRTRQHQWLDLPPLQEGDQE